MYSNRVRRVLNEWKLTVYIAKNLPLHPWLEYSNRGSPEYASITRRYDIKKDLKPVTDGFMRTYNWILYDVHLDSFVHNMCDEVVTFDLGAGLPRDVTENITLQNGVYYVYEDALPPGHFDALEREGAVSASIEVGENLLRR